MRTATPVNFTLDLNGRSGPRSSQVARALIDAIARGQVHDGDRLPSTRTLAATFGLARTAVVAAYEELTAAGFLVARPGGSTYVERGAGAAARAGAFGAVLTGASGAGLPPPAPAAPRPARPITYDLRPGLADPGLISERGLDPGHAAGRLAGPGGPPGPARSAHRPPAPRPRSCRRPGGHLPVPERQQRAPGGRRHLRADRAAGRVRGSRLRQGPARPARGGRDHPAGARRRRRHHGPGPAGERPGLLRHAGPPVPAGRPDAGAPPGRPAGLGDGQRRARAGGRLRRRVPLRRGPAEPAAQHARGRRSRGLPGHQLEDPGPRAARVLGRAARPVPRRDGRLPGRLRRGGQPGLGRLPGQLHRHRRADPPSVPGHAHLPGPAGALRRRLPRAHPGRPGARHRGRAARRPGLRPAAGRRSRRRPAGRRRAGLPPAVPVLRRARPAGPGCSAGTRGCRRPWPGARPP